MAPPPSPDDRPPPSRSLKLRPAEGDVVNRSLSRGKEPRHDGPTQADIERFSDATRVCPNCRKTVYDDTELCYHCGEAMNAPEHRRRTPWWTIAVVVLLIATMLLGVIGGLRF